MNNQNSEAQRMQIQAPDEINLLEYFYVLIKNKWLIICLTLFGLIGGYVTAIIIGPNYIADAVIAPREKEKQSSGNISGFGMLGSMVASQLNLGGMASLEWVDIVLNSRKFNAELVDKKKLMPLIYSDMWDTVEKKWDEEFIVPESRATGRYIKGKFLEKETNKNGTMTISIESKDSLFSYKLLSAYMEYLDEYIRYNVQKDARENRDYLENQIIGVTDPLLRAKIQELIAREVEKMMVVSKEAFKVVDPVLAYKSFKEKKLFPLLFAFGFFFITVLFVVFKHAFFSTGKTDEDRGLIENMRREIFRRPFGK